MNIPRQVGTEDRNVRADGLNLRYLREGVAPAMEPESAPSDQALSRRDLLKVAGVAAAAAGVLPALERAAAARVSFRTEPGQAALFLDGAPRWVIREQSFGGRPSLRVTRSAEMIRVSLTGATYPGTHLPADMTAELPAWLAGGAALPDAAAPTMRLALDLGGFRTRVDLLSWLAGESSARSAVRLPELLTEAGPGQGILLGGTAAAVFFPDWTLRLEGRAIARVEGMDGEPVSDSVTIALAAPDAPSLLAAPPHRRTTLTLTRGERPWSVLPLLPGLALGPTAVDRIRLEAGVNSRGNARAAMVAEGRGSALAAARDLTLPLDAVRLAISGETQAVTGRFAAEPVWYQSGDLRLLLGDAPGNPPFEAIARGGRLRALKAEPALLAVTAPMKDLITEIAWNPGGTRLRIAAEYSGDGSPTYTRISQVTQEVGTITPQLDLPPIIQLPINLSIAVIRPQDLLVLRFEFVNLTLATAPATPAKLTKADAGKSAYIIVHFQPQHITELAFFEATTAAGSDPLTDPPVKSRMAGPSRLVFRLNPAITEIPFELEALLQWAQLEQTVAPHALPPPLRIPGELKDPDLCDCAPVTPGLSFPPPPVREPRAQESAIEAPYRVIISPNRFAGWAHSPTPVEHAGRTELWHTRLGVRQGMTVDEQEEYLRTIRAVWSPDYTATIPVPTADLSVFKMSLQTRHRNQIVRLSSDFTISNFVPRPVKVERLMLSSLGAWMNVRGAWAPPTGFTLEEWRHRATQGRDTYVRVVEKGFLFPLGHRASLVTVTERKFQPSPSGKTVAYLRQRQFVVVREPTKTFPIAGQANDGRALPFTSLTVQTLVTPNLDLPVGLVSGQGNDAAFWCRVAGKDFPFHIAAVDIEGQKVEFSMPLAFILSTVADQEASILQVLNSMSDERKNRPMAGQKLAYATADKPGDTSFETSAFWFSAEVPDQATALGTDQPRFFPKMQQAEVRIAAVEQLAGSAAATTIEHHQAYLDSDVDGAANKGNVFAKLKSTVPMNLPADKSGGLSTPNMDVSTLSRKLGPLGGDPDQVAGGTWDPSSVLNNGAKILGGILLSDILDALGIDELGGDGKKAPKITNRVKYPEVGGKENKDGVPIGLETKMEWAPDVKSDPLKIFVADAKTKLILEAILLAKFDSPTEPEFSIKGELHEFSIDLIAPVASFLILKFKSITFTYATGEKMNVDPVIEDVEFGEALEFISKLQEFLSAASGGSGGLSLDVSATGITVGYGLPIPSVQVGVLNLANMALSIGFTIPFNGDPVRLRFAFCERENPFVLTVSLFGGGGFFAVALGLDGIELLEASLEFGGAAALDIGVASGSISLMAGIYFKMEGDACELEGYVRLNGSVSVLGIITISVEFYLGLKYQSVGNKVYGQATLTVKVEVLFFSVSVDLTVERQFSGDESDPTIADLMDQSHWDEYCEAFA